MRWLSPDGSFPTASHKESTLVPIPGHPLYAQCLRDPLGFRNRESHQPIELIRTMQAVILAGGLGTRLSEETGTRPKPMIEIGGRPILWHIMKIYSAHHINDFIIPLGYKGYMIKEYFANYFLHMSDVTIDLSKNDMEVHQHNVEPWRVTLVDTGETTMTGGRIKRIKDFIKEDSFCLTYGDGVGDIDITKSIQFHKSHGKLVTLTATQPPGRFGALRLKADAVTEFIEKPEGDGAWINGGFFVLSNKAIDYIENDQSIWEREPLINLAMEGQISAYFHHGFWQPMDTMRDKLFLEKLWASGEAPWKNWT
jgi:glucose-1-phosphate cytidylyltransferase